MYQGSTTPSIYLPKVRYENPLLRAFLIEERVRESSMGLYGGSMYGARRRRRGSCAPKVLIAPYASNKAMKPLGSTISPAAAERTACEGGSADHHGCAAVKKKRETKEI